MDRNRNNVVLSRRVLLEEGRKNERAEILSKLSKGMRLKGNVSSIVDFGAFVDLGGIDGLVHISELSWNHVNHPSEVVKVGDEVEVEVLDVDLQRERISLGLKQTTPDPWIQLVENYPVGTMSTARLPRSCLRRLRRAGRLHRGPGAHLRDGRPPHRHPGAGRACGRRCEGEGHGDQPDRRRISLSMKAAAEELGFEIDVDESVQAEEKPARRKKDEAPAEAEVVEVETVEE